MTVDTNKISPTPAEIAAKANNNGQDEAGTGETDYPKKSDGSVDMEQMSPEQQAKYWKDRNDGSARSFEKAKSDWASEKESLLVAMGQQGGNLDQLADKAAKAENLSEFEDLIPNFKNLPPDEQTNVRTFYTNVERRIRRSLDNDPAIKNSRAIYAEDLWEKGFAKAAAAVPGLSAKKEDFKKLYFKSENTPENIGELLITFGKSYMFDAATQSAKEEGAEEERKRNQGVDLMDPNGGDKGQGGNAGMKIEDWDYLSRTNPQEFARRQAEFDKQMAAGKLKE